MTDTGNAAQVRVIAEQLAGQLFEAWRAEQAQLGEKQRASWPAWFGVMLGAISIVFAAGSLRSDVATATTRIDKLEQRADSQDTAGKQVTDRLARIETKLDLALEHRKGGK
jgi:hypothetical protein